MGSLGDGVKKVLLAGIGTAAVTAEKSKRFWIRWQNVEKQL